ncbi:hypothetical protein PC9H_006786 [Pleurotus ostreatus]|uniref:NADP-dependent oxidoreductase domain-containing protein n=1 Tax=Pleurotus ostreatus TaxID=5322 RepID=A0A8H6ZXM2_PLEOS|nr:uncharacterized protein PC9H_006786 [Pleurotus ostreatus]KAF7431068.1 hypothetical protein PC9H_006786 [Pleurotus ostreatus]KAJ8695464.1 hypothetical protein PTI98_008065 [Pleurotus ostreatus]
MNDALLYKLNNGLSIPALGVGCWMGQVGESDQVRQMIVWALELGYRHIDTASNYGNEESVGKGLRDSGVDRAEVFITTKLASEDHGRVSAALDESLVKLGTSYVDLFLMHWPQALTKTGEALPPDASPTIAETWREMEILVETGKAKSIGVSNFSIKLLDKLLESARIIPAINQVEAHPCLPQHSLLEYCRHKGLLLTAYSPVAKNKLSGNDVLGEIAAKHNATVAQVLLSWGIGRSTIVIPKSANLERLKENLTLISLSPEEMRIINELHKEEGMHHSVCGFHSAALGGSCFGWTYEQLGWEMALGGVVPR